MSFHWRKGTKKERKRQALSDWKKFGKKETGSNENLFLIPSSFQYKIHCHFSFEFGMENSISRNHPNFATKPLKIPSWNLICALYNMAIFPHTCLFLWSRPFSISLDNLFLRCVTSNLANPKATNNNGEQTTEKLIKYFISNDFSA